MITWISSYPKSGNTWLRLLLNAYFRGDCDINRISATVSDTRPYYYQVVNPKASAPTYSESLILRPAALLHMLEVHGDCMMKTHHANETMSGMPLIPEALTKRAIYLVRDPRDVVISKAHHFGLSLDDAITELANSNRAVTTDCHFHLLTSWSEHVKSWSQGHFPIFALKYEDMLKQPEQKLKEVLTFLEVGIDSKKVKKSVEMASFQNLKAQEEKHGFREASDHQQEFFRHGGSVWREVLTDRQAQRIESDHGEMMKFYHYL